MVRLTSMVLLTRIFVAGAALASAGATWASPAPQAAELFAAVRAAAPAPAPPVAAPAPPVAAPAAPDTAAEALKTAGIARTGLDHSFANPRLVGSVGFLCGLQPAPDAKGAMSAYGVDDQGRFLGAKLHFAFR